MGNLTSNPYSVADAEEYLTYLSNVFAEVPKVQAEGRIPADDAVLSFLDDLQVVRTAIRNDVNRAKASGATQITTDLQLTTTEYRRLISMGESLQNLLLILEMRKAVTLERGEGAARVTQAFHKGVFTD